MVQSVNALVVAVLAVATAVVQGLYVQYELFSASDCNAASHVQTGIAAGVGACVVVRTGVVPELNGYASRRFECNSIINYPYHDNCQELTPDEVSPNLPPRKVTAMNTCEKLDDGTTTGTVKYARYTCRSGGFVRIRQASSCNFTGDPQGITADDFYLENGACTPGFNENSAEISQSSDRAIVDGDHVALVSWSSSNSCGGVPSSVNNYTTGTCVGDSVTKFLAEVTSSGYAIIPSTALVLTVVASVLLM